MKIPAKLKIGGLTYTVQVKKELEDCAGKIHYKKMLIEVEESHPDYMAITLLHEILHAMNAEFKESDIEFLAQGLFQVFKDNPDLFKGGVKNGRNK